MRLRDSFVIGANARTRSTQGAARTITGGILLWHLIRCHSLSQRPPIEMKLELDADFWAQHWAEDRVAARARNPSWATTIHRGIHLELRLGNIIDMTQNLPQGLKITGASLNLRYFKIRKQERLSNGFRFSGSAIQAPYRRLFKRTMIQVQILLDHSERENERLGLQRAYSGLKKFSSGRQDRTRERREGRYGTSHYEVDDFPQYHAETIKVSGQLQLLNAIRLRRYRDDFVDVDGQTNTQQNFKTRSAHDIKSRTIEYD
ncbi:hypothetical protein CC78DRAFT_617119 [Lojkania enalia]|uniref:Uncharacterized protein n=1 Tax=Lojkania enalia TaxID=147567 RepID=A0A9P4KDG6_9PLEO|nr:hypothetical protein CC78DRAFT_617119 [Didymosphaeria enalia]